MHEYLAEYVLIPHHRQHVFRDLMAYSCTFEHCDSGLFESRIAWKTHEIAEHRRDWHCPSCQHDFGTRDSVARHISAEHPDIEDELVHALVTAASPQHTSAKISDCPFCDDHQARSNILYQGPATVQREPISYDLPVSIDFYQRHLSRHMEQLALFAVPPADDDDEDEEEQLSQVAGDSPVLSNEEYDDELEDEDSDDEQPSQVSKDSIISSARPDAQTTPFGEDLLSPDHVMYDDEQQQLNIEVKSSANTDQTGLFECMVCGRMCRDLAGLRYEPKKRSASPFANRSQETYGNPQRQKV